MQQLKLPLLVSANLKPADGFRSSKGHASTRCSVDDTSNQPMSAERAMLELLAKSKDVAAVVSSWKMRVDVRAVWYFKIFKACRFWQVLKTDIYIYITFPPVSLKSMTNVGSKLRSFSLWKKSVVEVLHVFWVGVVQSCWSFGRVAGHNPMTILTETTGSLKSFRTIFKKKERSRCDGEVVKW